MERIKIVSKILLALLLFYSVNSCKNPTDLLDSLEDEVKLANDLYLEIVNLSPGNNSDSVDPGVDIQIEFDREINMDSIETYFSLIDSEENSFESEFGKSIEYSFNTTTNILTVEAQPYLKGLEEYTLNILDGLTGVDGSQLRDSQSLSFSTKDAPRGTIEIQSEYTNETTVSVFISTQGATYYWISTDENFTTGDWEPITSGTVQDEIVFSGGEGEKTIYAKFRDGAVSEAATANISGTEDDTVIYDLTPPSISFSQSTVYSNAGTSADLDGNVTDNYGIEAIDTYQWEEVDGSSVSINSESSKTTSATAASDGDYTLKLTVTDKAGNSSSRDLVYTRDSVDPVLSINSTVTKPTSADFTLTAVASDSETDIASYSWEQRSGVETVYFSSKTVFNPTVQIPAEKSYTVRITVTDRAGNSKYLDIVLTGNNSAPKITLDPVLYFNSSDTISADLVNAGTSPTVSWERSTDGLNFTGVSSTENISSGAGTSQVTINESANQETEYTYRISVDNGSYTTVASSAVYWDTKDPVVDLGSTVLYANSSNTTPTASCSVTEGGSGIKTYSWSGSSLSFGSPSASSTTVYASSDGSYTLTLTVNDKAGNSGSDTRTYTRDTVSPGAPSVTASDSNPSSDKTPEFSLSAGSGGIASFRYNINGGTWNTYNGSYVSVPYGGSTVYFQGRDTAGNWSGSTGRTTVVYPTKTVYPSDGSGNVGREDIAWPWSSGYYYEFYIGSGILRPGLVGGYRYYPFVDSSELTLASYTSYSWYVKVYTRSGIYPKYSYTLYSTGPTYRFSTGFIGKY